MKTLTKTFLLLLMVFSLLQVAYALDLFDRNNLQGVHLYQFSNEVEAIESIMRLQMSGKITTQTEVFMRFDEVTGRWNILINNLEKSSGVHLEYLIKASGIGDHPYPLP